MNKKVRNKLMDLGSRVPQELLDKVQKEEPLTPTMKKVFVEGMKSDKVRDEIKDDMQDLLNSGKLDRTYMKVDEKIKKQIDEWAEKEIKRMIEAGELPDPKTDTKTKQWLKKMWKGQRKASESESKKDSSTNSKQQSSQPSSKETTKNISPQKKKTKQQKQT